MQVQAFPSWGRDFTFFTFLHCLESQGNIIRFVEHLFWHCFCSHDNSIVCLGTYPGIVTMAMAGVLDRAKKTMVSICAVMVSQLVLCVYCNVQSVLYTLQDRKVWVRCVSRGRRNGTRQCKWVAPKVKSVDLQEFSFYLLFLTYHLETHSFIHRKII